MSKKVSGNNQKILQEHPWLWAVNSAGWAEIKLKVSRVDYMNLPTYLVFKPGDYLSVWALFTNKDIPNQFDHRVLCVSKKTTENNPIRWAERMLDIINRNSHEWRIKFIAIEKGHDSATALGGARSTITICKPKNGLEFDQIMIPIIENTDSCVSIAVSSLG